MIIDFYVNLCLNSLCSKSPENIILLDLRKFDAISDFFIICHGNSLRQVKGISDYIKLDLKKQNIQLLNIEGAKNGNWIIMDYGSVVIHIFEKKVREYYNLEEIWDNAKTLKVEITSDKNSKNNFKFIPTKTSFI